MQIIKISASGDISLHEFSDDIGTLRALIGPECNTAEHVRPKRLYTVLGGGAECTWNQGEAVAMLVDEEGYYHDLPVNFIASWLYETDKHGYPILGDVLIIGEYLDSDGIAFSGLCNTQIQLLLPQLMNLSDQIKRRTL